MIDFSLFSVQIELQITQHVIDTNYNAWQLTNSLNIAFSIMSCVHACWKLNSLDHFQVFLLSLLYIWISSWSHSFQKSIYFYTCITLTKPVFLQQENQYQRLMHSPREFRLFLWHAWNCYQWHCCDSRLVANLKKTTSETTLVHLLLCQLGTIKKITSYNNCEQKDK